MEANGMADRNHHDRQSRGNGSENESTRHAGGRQPSRDDSMGRESGSQSDRGIERNRSGSQTGVSDRERMGASGRSSESGSSESGSSESGSSRFNSSDREPAEGRRDLSE
jgi:hypothetical protein